MRQASFLPWLGLSDRGTEAGWMGGVKLLGNMHLYYQNKNNRKEKKKAHHH